MRREFSNFGLLVCVLAMTDMPWLCASQCQNICGNFNETCNARETQLRTNQGRYKRSAEKETFVSYNGTNRTRIVNGYRPEHSRGFLALVRLYLPSAGGSSIKCVGSIINDRFILTAGHCVCTADHHIFGKEMSCDDGKTSYNVDDLKVYVGLTPLQDVSLIERNHASQKDVKEVKIHPKWKGDMSSPGFVDIALLKLKEALKFDARVAPICLPVGESLESFPEHGYVAGWGTDQWKEICFTNNLGPARNLPCKKPFKFRGKDHFECKLEDSPNTLNPQCQKFDEANPEFDWSTMNYVIIRYPKSDKSKKKGKTKCYNPDFGEDGWCGVEGGDKSSHKDALYISKGNWGFCSKHCAKDPKKHKKNQLQEVQLSVLKKEDCVLYYSGDDHVLNKGTEFCAAMKHDFPKVKVFKRKETTEDGERKFSYKLTGTKTDYLNTHKRLQKLDYYVGFSDSCGGDSGGPFFQIGKDEKFYVTGVVSRGAKKCGVFNIPGVYTSLLSKSVQNWILNKSKEGSCRTL